MVKEGYKQTEIGVIPEDWEVKPLQLIAPLQRGFDLPYSQMQDGPYPVVFSNGIGAFHNKYMVKGPGVVTGRSGTIGKVHFIYSDFWPHNTSLWVTDFHGNDPRFIYYLFQTIQWNLFNSGSGVPTLNRNDVHSTKYIVPTQREQKRIAEALSDIDELIFSLEKLIAKKKAIKQGAMQQLLTGKTRLPGYTDKWNQNTFEELFDILPNNAYTRDQLSIDGTIKNIHYGDILTKYGAVLDGKNKDIPTLAPDLEKKKRPESQFVHSGDIIIADTAEDETVGKAVELYNVNCKILSGLHTFFCHPKVKFAPMFLGYYLNSTEFHAQMLPYITGTKVSSISKQSLNMLVLQYPRKEEQEEIAKILYEMDCEMEALEKKLAKVTQNKQGMLQQLLTGKIRLI